MSTTVQSADVQKLVADELGKLGADSAAVTPQATFEELDVDSLDLVELAQAVEEELGVEISGDDAAELVTVGDAIDLILSRRR